MSTSWTQDADKYEALYNGKLYDKRQKMSFECKEDIYRDYTDFNASLLTQFDYKEYIRLNDGDPTSISADLMMKIIDYADQLDNASEKEEDMLKIGGQMGVGIYKFQPFKCDGYWWPGVEVIDTRQFGISPGASTPQDAVFCYWRRPVPTSELKQKYPDQADSIQPDADASNLEGRPNNQGGTISITGLATGAVQNMSSLLQDAFNKSPKLQTWTTEFYYKDPEIIEIADTDSLLKWIAANPGFGNEFFCKKVQVEYERQLADGPIKVKKYPFGRRMIMVKDAILEDSANPYYTFPFFGWKCFARPKTFWAKGVCEVIREPAQNYHLLLASLAVNLDYSMRPAYQETNVRGGAGDLGKTKQINTMPNSLMSVSGEIKAIPVPSVTPQGVIDLAELRRRNLETSSGLSSTLGGVNPVGNYSSTQLEKLMEGALGKVAPRLRALNRTRKTVGTMKLWFVQNYCTDERDIDFLSAEDYQAFTANEYQGPDGVKNDVQSGSYKYFIDVDVKRPASYAERFRQIQEVGKLISTITPASGMVQIEAVKMQLEAMDLPGKYDIMRRFDKAVAQMQQQDMQLKQQQVQIQQQQMAQTANLKERELDTKEIIAGAKAQEAIAWVLTNLPKAGLQVPASVMDELNVVATQTKMQDVERQPGV